MTPSIRARRAGPAPTRRPCAPLPAPLVLAPRPRRAASHVASSSAATIRGWRRLRRVRLEDRNASTRVLTSIGSARGRPSRRCPARSRRSARSTEMSARRPRHIAGERRRIVSARGSRYGDRAFTLPMTRTRRALQGLEQGGPGVAMPRRALEPAFAPTFPPPLDAAPRGVAATIVASTTLPQIMGLASSCGASCIAVRATWRSADVAGRSPDRWRPPRSASPAERTSRAGPSSGPRSSYESRAAPSRRPGSSFYRAFSRVASPRRPLALGRPASRVHVERSHERPRARTPGVAGRRDLVEPFGAVHDPCAPDPSSRVLCHRSSAPVAARDDLPRPPAVGEGPEQGELRAHAHLAPHRGNVPNEGVGRARRRRPGRLARPLGDGRPSVHDPGASTHRRCALALRRRLPSCDRHAAGTHDDGRDREMFKYRHHTAVPQFRRVGRGRASDTARARLSAKPTISAGRSPSPHAIISPATCAPARHVMMRAIAAAARPVRSSLCASRAGCGNIDTH